MIMGLVLETRVDVRASILALGSALGWRSTLGVDLSYLFEGALDS